MNVRSFPTIIVPKISCWPTNFSPASCLRRTMIICRNYTVNSVIEKGKWKISRRNDSFLLMIVIICDRDIEFLNYGFYMIPV